MLEKNFSVNVYLKKPKFYEAGDPFQVYIRITVDSERVEITAKRTWDPKRWNARSGRAEGSREDARELNKCIDALTHKIHEARRQLIEANKEITPYNIKNLLNGINDRKYIIEVFKEHNIAFEALVPREYSAGTLDLFKRTLLHTESYIKWKYKKEDLEIHNLDYEFIERFCFWLKSVRKCQHNSAMKYLTYFKKIVLLCVKRKWLSQDPFAEFSMARRETTRPYLTKKELSVINQKEFGVERLTLVRDIFLFSCYTGLAYADVQKLSRMDVIKGEDGRLWIDAKREKTETAFKLPLLQIPLGILKKYEDYPMCEVKGKILPILSNQKMNAYLKEIADVCGIKKVLTFHIARHTFATTVTLSNGVPIETVSKMLGHKSLKQTQHYAKIVDAKIGSDMLVLEEKLAAERG
ncbi:site-specific integrase [Mucilaginibacter limnophilus]|uniref:Site-specific integrase n=1 Tax=Mucilaginibacter limnophilus TaxID=1932778 RepID=A0A437MZN3_9SPHI|nr:site-specific integrase [Mucilaginibacter limnophilus]RVU03125.1 site-specific integrase [Mucilaginibacter limnophilus]